MSDFCPIAGCGRRAPKSPKTGRSQVLCHEHWSQLGLDLQLEFWRRTQYGRQPMPRDLLERCNTAFEKA